MVTQFWAKSRTHQEGRWWVKPPGMGGSEPEKSGRRRQRRRRRRPLGSLRSTLGGKMKNNGIWRSEMKGFVKINIIGLCQWVAPHTKLHTGTAIHLISFIYFCPIVSLHVSSHLSFYPILSLFFSYETKMPLIFIYLIMFRSFVFRDIHFIRKVQALRQMGREFSV